MTPQRRTSAAAAGLLAAGLFLTFGARAFAGQAFQKVVVRPGDTLWGIARTYLKDPDKWNEILKYNTLPSQDPTVALPGMVLRVPVSLIKESLQAAYLVQKENTVYFRRRETADWKSAALHLDLYQGDSLRTLDNASARVKFLTGGLLAMNANSMAIIQPPKADYDVDLERGSIFVGHARVVTASARIEPKTKDTQYMAKVGEDLSTIVEVYRGRAAVTAQGQTVNVNAGMTSVVPDGLAPNLPQKIADFSALQDQAAQLGGVKVAGSFPSSLNAGAHLGKQALKDASSGIAQEVASLEIGVPISGYRVQASRSPAFDKLVFNKVFSQDEKFDPASVDLPPGVYWWRIALIDLLGSQEDFSEPKRYAIGVGESQGIDASSLMLLIHPQDGENAFSPDYRVSGRLKSDQATVSVDGRPARQDEEGNFFADIRLKAGINTVTVTVQNASGQSASVSRTVRYSPGGGQ